MKNYYLLGAFFMIVSCIVSLIRQEYFYNVIACLIVFVIIFIANLIKKVI